MSEPARRAVTYRDVLDAPEHLVAEILTGELHLSPRPGYAHQNAASEAGADLVNHFKRSRGGRPGGWVILDEPELHLGDPDPRSLVMVPDLAGWRRERFEPPTGHGHTLAPDWVCEVISPGPENARRDRMLKPELYYAASISWLWLIDPENRVVEVFSRQEVGWVRKGVFAGHVEARIPPFDAVAVDMSHWWVGEPEVDDGG